MRRTPGAPTAEADPWYVEEESQTGVDAEGGNATEEDAIMLYNEEELVNGGSERNEDSNIGGGDSNDKGEGDGNSDDRRSNSGSEDDGANSDDNWVFEVFPKTFPKKFEFAPEQICHLERIFSVKKHISVFDIEYLAGIGIYPEVRVQEWFKKRRKQLGITDKIHIGEKHGLNTKWFNEELESKSDSANR